MSINTEKTTTEKTASASVFTKEQIVKSKRYADKRDLLNAVLDNGKKYTFVEVDNIINNYKKGKVK